MENTVKIDGHIELDRLLNQWTNITDLCANIPSARFMFGFSYDPIDTSAVFFGGADDSWSNNDTWTFDLKTNTWYNVSTPNSPCNRYRTSMTVDTTNHAAILFGGEIGNPYGVPSEDGNDTWIYYIENGTWIEKTPVLSPSQRQMHSISYDPGNRLVYLFGGGRILTPPNNLLLNDTWSYDSTNNSWQNITPFNSPAPRVWSPLAFDSINNVFLLFGGCTGSESFSNETWIFNPERNEWTNMSPPKSPASRCSHGLVYDSDSGLFIMYGGFFWNGTWPDPNRFDTFLCDTWTYDYRTNTWSEIKSNITPPPLANFGMIYDSGNQRSVLFGGVTEELYSKREIWQFTSNGYCPAGQYTSAPIDLGGEAYFGNITWNASIPGGTNIRFQIRTADDRDKLNTSRFHGPNGFPTSYYSTSGQPIDGKENGTRWIQYRAFLSSTNSTTTPKLYDLAFNYNIIQEISIVKPGDGDRWSAELPIEWSASDKDNDPLTFDIYIENDTSSILLVNNLPDAIRNWSWNTSIAPNGTYRIRIIAYDNNSYIPLTVNALSGDFEVHNPPPPPNHPPKVELLSPANGSDIEACSTRLAWHGDDVDGDPLTYTVHYSSEPLFGAPHNISRLDEEFLDLQGLSNNMTYYWAVVAWDGKINSTEKQTQIWHFTVRLPPPNSPVKITSTPINRTRAGVEYLYNITAADEDGDVLVYGLVQGPPGMNVNPATGMLRWLPTGADAKNWTITVQVSDGRGSTDRQTFNLLVTNDTVPPEPVIRPLCRIVYPGNGSEARGQISVRGTAGKGSLPLVLVQLRLDGRDWSGATGLENWSFSLDTARLKNGAHHIDARAYDGQLYSNTTSIDFSVNNIAPQVSKIDFQWYIASILIMMAIIAGYVSYRMRKAR